MTIALWVVVAFLTTCIVSVGLGFYFFVGGRLTTSPTRRLR